MNEILLVSNIILWVGFIGLLLICFALVRQIGVLYERVAPAGALDMNQQLSTGDTAPEFELASFSGEMVSIGGTAKANSLLFFTSTTCPVCKSLLPVAKSLAQEQDGVNLIFASAGDDHQQHEKFISSNKLSRAQYVVSDELGMAYGVAKLPFAVLIGANGKIAAMGLVNTREHLESLFEAQERGVASLQDYLSKQQAG